MGNLVVRRAIAEHVGDQAAFARDAGGRQRPIQALTGAADERPAELDFIGPRSFTDKRQQRTFAVRRIGIVGEGKRVAQRNSIFRIS
jgi:hypothetical protein